MYNPELTKVSLRNYMKLVKIMPSMGGSNINFHDPVRNSLLP